MQSFSRKVKPVTDENRTIRGTTGTRSGNEGEAGIAAVEKRIFIPDMKTESEKQ
jgi:hypothetical protein